MIDNFIFMEETMLIQITNEKATALLNDLEDIHWIKVLSKSSVPNKNQKLSEKYKGILSKEEGASLNKHVQQTRNEWNNI